MSSVLDWHPRDLDTWMNFDAQAEQEARFARLHSEHSEQHGRG